MMLLSLCLAVAALVFRVVLWMRVRRAGDHRLAALLTEAREHLELAEQASTDMLHKAWFRALALEAQAQQPLRSGFALASWLRAVRNGLTMVRGMPAERHALAAMYAASEIGAHPQAPKGIA